MIPEKVKGHAAFSAERAKSPAKREISREKEKCYMSLLSIYSGSACAWIISEINRDTMGELQVVIPKAASTLLYPMVRPLTVRLGSLLLRIYSAFSFVLFSALYFLKTANIQELNVLLFAEYLLLCGIAELSLWGVRGVREKRIWRVWIVTILASVIALGMFLVLYAFC